MWQWFGTRVEGRDQRSFGEGVVEELKESQESIGSWRRGAPRSEVLAVFTPVVTWKTDNVPNGLMTQEAFQAHC